jgi:kynurenine formamidase
LDASNHRIGLQYWAPEGIAGRGILIDYAHWASSQSPPITYSTFSTHAIPFSTITAMIKEYKIAPRKGDILFIRTGVISEWDSMTDQQKQDYAAQEKPKHAGVEASMELLEWLWDSGISAVAGDAISWEVYPTPGAVSMHEYLLAGWGMPIGELFDLEALSKTCLSLNRWSFFLTSMPLNMPGGVSSPPNAMAIF